MPQTPLDPFQQIFMLSQASNLVSTCKGSALALQKQLAGTLTPDWFDRHVGPGWELAWGPAVWQSDASLNTGPDNVWFVAKSGSLTTNAEAATPVYVVCIAGSAGPIDKAYDWEVEDFGVGQIVNITTWTKHWGSGGVLSDPIGTNASKHDLTDPLLSHGTARGLYILASIPPATSEPPSSSPEHCLAEYLKGLSMTPDTRLIFTGHSLGGALAPSLAFILDKAGYLGGFAANTLVYPTAGASPGNDKFVSAFSTRFKAIAPSPDQPAYMTWNQNIVNKLDIVPHAWDTKATSILNLNVLPSIYGNGMFHSLEVYLQAWLASKWLCNMSLKASPGILFKENIYVPLPCSEFAGTPPASPPEIFKPDSNDPEKPSYIGDAAQQHMSAYAKLFFGPDGAFLQPLCPLTPETALPGMISLVANTPDPAGEGGESVKQELEAMKATATEGVN
ncbi:hypothetical protein FRC11_006651 [Ceratobasidium sp. 423]|nr:hypothetical protein FRC11_006651 [Ceratobasidium sp. 423]